MDRNTLSNLVLDHIALMNDVGFMTTEAELFGQPVIIIAAPEKGVITSEVELHISDTVVPLFIMPSPELITALINPQTKEMMFKMETVN